MTPDADRAYALAAGFPARLLDGIAGSALGTDTAAVTALRGALGCGHTVVVLAGPVGVGKSVAMARYGFAQIGAGRSARWLTAFDLARVSPYERTQIDGLLEPSVLLLDDLGREYLDDKGFALSLVDGLFSSRYDQGRETIITTNLPAAAFATRYGERLVDRIREVGTFVELPGASLRARAGA